jgi:hypothetical protein
LSPICWWNESSSCQGNPGFNFTNTSCITCYHSTQINWFIIILQIWCGERSNVLLTYLLHGAETFLRS